MNGNEIQIENGGFTRIHNAILDKLATTDLNGSEFRCLMFLLRNTYGYGKTENKISFEEWSEGTALDKRNMRRVLKQLADRKIIFCDEGGGGRSHTNIYGFNKYFEQWDELNKGEMTPVYDKTKEGELTPVNDENKGELTPVYELNRGELTPRNRGELTPPTTKKEKKEETTTTTPSVVIISSADVFELWKNNMPGSLTEIIVDELNDFIDTYGAIEVDNAIRIAVKQGKRNTRYIHGILKKRADGTDHKPLESSILPVSSGVININFAAV